MFLQEQKHILMDEIQQKQQRIEEIKAVLNSVSSIQIMSEEEMKPIPGVKHKLLALCEKELISKVLNDNSWNRKITSDILGISGRTLDRKIVVYDLHNPLKPRIGYKT